VNPVSTGPLATISALISLTVLKDLYELAKYFLYDPLAPDAHFPAEIEQVPVLPLPEVYG